MLQFIRRASFSYLCRLYVSKNVKGCYGILIPFMLFFKAESKSWGGLTSLSCMLTDSLEAFSETGAHKSLGRLYLEWINWVQSFSIKHYERCFFVTLIESFLSVPLYQDQYFCISRWGMLRCLSCGFSGHLTQRWTITWKFKSGLLLQCFDVCFSKCTVRKALK